jgi:hypothetical protein
MGEVLEHPWGQLVHQVGHDCDSLPSATPWLLALVAATVGPCVLKGGQLWDGVGRRSPPGWGAQVVQHASAVARGSTISRALKAGSF